MTTDVETGAEGTVPEPEKEISSQEVQRRRQRKQEVDAVADLLTEAFGASVLEDRAEETVPAEDETGDMTMAEILRSRLPGRKHVWDMASLEEEFGEGKAARHRLLEALKRVSEALKRVGIPPAMLGVYALVTGMVMIFGAPALFWVAALGMMVFFTMLKMSPLDVLGVMSLLVFTMEAADIVRQWGRISALLGL
ncbi:MAG: hypothetical protein JW909_12865 [Planctomycetes bacterium]|nr:hypothetical protein [Planctomycetota bacterium]